MSSAADVGEDVVDELSAALVRVQTELDAIAAAALALGADPAGPIPDLAVLAQRRDAALLEVGRALTRAVRQGFQLVLEEPAEEELPQVELAVEDAPDVPSAPPPDAEPRAVPHVVEEDPVPATEASIERLSRQLGSPGWTESTDAAHMVAPLARAWGAPDAPADVASLLRASARLDAWLDLPRGVQSRLLSYAVLRSRHVQGHIPDRDAHALVTVFRRLTAWSKKHQPGYVYGLARDHTPDRGSWLADARVAWEALGVGRAATPLQAPRLGALITLLEADQQDADEIRRLTLMLLDHSDIDQRHLDQVLEPHMALLKGDRRFKRLKKRIRRRTKTVAPSSARTPLDEDWPGLVHTREKRALAVGGDNRQQIQQKLQDALGFAEVHWDNGRDPRRTASCAERVRSGQYDLVLLVRRFVHHGTTDVIVPACKESKTPLVAVAGGYGLRAVKHAIEKHLKMPGEADAD